MLQRLRVRDFAIVDQIEIAFDAGFSVVTGETGAGKSLVVDALGLLRGARGDAAWIRHGAERAEIEAEFALGEVPAASAWLRERELDDDEDHSSICRIRRTLRVDGASRAYVNDRAVSLALLRELSTHLLAIHGQHEHQALLDRGRQLELLDAVADHNALMDAVKAATTSWRNGERRLAELTAMGASDPALMELLEFQVAELERDGIGPDALTELVSDHRRLAHSRELIAGSQRVAELLDGDGEQAGVNARIGAAVQQVEALRAHDPALDPIATSLAQASAALDDAALALARYLDRQDVDPARLDELDARLTQLHALARKHRVKPEEIAGMRDSLRERCEALRNAGGAIDALRAEQIKSLHRYSDASRQLSQSRREAAMRLSAATLELMQQLGMAAGQFSIEVHSDLAGPPSAQGADSVEMMVSTNAGQPLRPLRKVASGGELSRIGLALQVAAKGTRPAPTLVFDEVDSGIGGAVAEIVGRLLHRLAERSQVLCVTHLAQVAAQADHHFTAMKSTAADQTQTSLQSLDRKQRTAEIARMLGGVAVGTETLAHARQMLRTSKSG